MARAAGVHRASPKKNGLTFDLFMTAVAGKSCFLRAFFIAPHELPIP
jgi:hypothetical protein